ncbi:MAG TPA: hypothetical protein VMS31_04990 [Pyrinomonadaceae bacterium]|nr:hypothetical protein [Pyrinomonadaceae bacterium]
MKRTEIIIETERLLVRSKGLSMDAWCAVCGVRVSMLTPTEAAQMQIPSTTTREIYRRIEAGEVHGVDAADGEVFICARSLPNANV